MSSGSRTYLTMAVGGLVLGTLLLLSTILFRGISAREGVLDTTSATALLQQRAF
jgi:hypothetical protein